jgi:hypothetical protein
MIHQIIKAFGASIDSGKAVWGKAFSLMFGATGSIGMNAEQQTRDEESIVNR